MVFPIEYEPLPRGRKCVICGDNSQKNLGGGQHDMVVSVRAAKMVGVGQEIILNFTPPTQHGSRLRNPRWSDIAVAVHRSCIPSGGRIKPTLRV